MSSPLQITVTPEPCPYGFNTANRAPTVTEEIEHAICEAGHPSPDTVWIEGIIGAGLAGLLFPEVAAFAGIVAGGLAVAFALDKGVNAALDSVKTTLSNNPVLLGGAALAAGWYIAPAAFALGAATRRRRRKRRT